MIFNMTGGGSGSGATLVVSCPANVTVTVSKDDKSYIKNSGNLGSATFKGLATGEWTVTIEGNEQTATKNITITADYAITMAFFAAYINITYPANSTCTVKTSGGTTVASDSNTDSSAKTWTATVNATGTYTITATATDGSGKSKSTTVSITADGQSESATLTYELVLFDGGDVSDITGGWDSSGTGGSASVGTIISMSVSDDTGYAKVRTLTTKNSIDLTGFNLLVASIKSISGDGNMKAGDSASVTISKTGNVSLDISKISSEQKISFEIGAWNSSTSLQVDRVWLE